VIIKSSKLQDIVFQALQRMDKLECTLKVLRNENILLWVKNITLQNKVTELKIKPAEIRKNSSNPSKPYCLISQVLINKRSVAKT